MANIKSAKKRAKTNELHRQKNVARKSEIRTTIKDYLKAVEENNTDKAKELFKAAESKISRAVNKKLIKKILHLAKSAVLQKSLLLNN